MSIETTTTRTNGSPDLTTAVENAGTAELDQARNRAQAALDAARETVDLGLGAAREKAAALGAGIKEKASEARQSLSKGVDTVKAGAIERYEGARKGVRKAANQSEEFVQKHPTGTVVDALAVGAAAGIVASTLAGTRRRRKSGTAKTKA
jgi:ElaB/YqjD/DUF883 family membrane-anchored ribosome-binding protein